MSYLQSPGRNGGFGLGAVDYSEYLQVTGTVDDVESAREWAHKMLQHVAERVRKGGNEMAARSLETRHREIDSKWIIRFGLRPLAAAQKYTDWFAQELPVWVRQTPGAENAIEAAKMVSAELQTVPGYEKMLKQENRGAATEDFLTRLEQVLKKYGTWAAIVLAIAVVGQAAAKGAVEAALNRGERR